MLAEKLLGTVGNATNPIYVEDVFSTYLYTGNGNYPTTTPNVITNGIDLAGKGGMVWIKNRVQPDGHVLSDSARGKNPVWAYKWLQSNLTNAQQANPSYGITSFNADGFTLDDPLVQTYQDSTNRNGETYVSWTFRKQAKFFDVVTYTGDGVSGRAISHNLGSTPGCMIVKRTDSTSNWGVYHRSMGNGAIGYLESTAAFYTSVSDWYYTSPTNTNFTVNVDYNQNGGTYVAYLFAHDAGGFGATGTDNVISCGSYTGNGSTTGPTVTLGYEPQWLLIKNASNSDTVWTIVDVMRGMGYGGTNALRANATTSETDLATTTPYVIPTATGFNIVNTTGSYYNANGSTYIYIAIRRGPMATPTTGTSVFSPIYIDSGQGTTGFPIDLQLSNYTSGSSYNTVCVDRLRGVSSNSTDSGYALVTSQTSAEASGFFSKSFNNTGFSAPFLWDGVTTIYYNFRRAPGFFDEVCYTGTGANRTLNHNLGVVPELLIAKRRSTTRAWGIMPEPGKFLEFDADPAANSSDSWLSSTSSTIDIGVSNSLNTSGQTYVMYMFATLAGVSKVGSYTGTGSTQQINCGFSGGARFVLIKRTDSTGDWYVWDTARGIVSGNDPYLLLNSTAAQVTNTDYVDTYSAGFEISSTAPAAINANGGSFIYLAIA